MKGNSTRREFLSKLSLIIGSTAASSLVSTSAFATALSFKPSHDSSKAAGNIFSILELRLLKIISAIVLPRTDTPSAADLDVHGFIDHQLHHCHEDADKKKVKSTLKLLDQRATSLGKKTFELLTPESQLQLIVALDAAKDNFNSTQQSHFRFLKSLICFGYYTTEIGATKALRYQAIPGAFKGTIPYKAEDKSWGSLGHSY